MEFKGSKYEVNKDLSTTEIAKLIRKEIKERFPNIKVSVHTEYFANGSSIDVWVQDAGFNPINPKWNPRDYSTPMHINPIYTEQGKQLLKDLEAIVNQYNRDNSDTQIDYFDVSFYSDVSYSSEFEHRCMLALGIKVEP